MTTVLALTAVFLALSALLAWGVTRWFRIQRAYDLRDRDREWGG